MTTQFKVLDVESNYEDRFGRFFREEIIQMGDKRLKVTLSIGHRAGTTNTDTKVCTAMVFDPIMLTWNPLITVQSSILPTVRDITNEVEAYMVGQAQITEGFDWEKQYQVVVDFHLDKIRDRMMAKAAAVLL